MGMQAIMAGRPRIKDETLERIKGLLRAGVSDKDAAQVARTSERTVRTIRQQLRAEPESDADPLLPALDDDRLTVAETKEALRLLRDQMMTLATETFPQRIRSELAAGRGAKGVRDLVTAMVAIERSTRESLHHFETLGSLPTGKLPRGKKARERLYTEVILGHAKLGSTRAAMALPDVAGIQKTKGVTRKIEIVDVQPSDYEDQAATASAEADPEHGKP